VHVPPYCTTSFNGMSLVEQMSQEVFRKSERGQHGGKHSLTDVLEIDKVVLSRSCSDYEVEVEGGHLFWG
jgi:hypothetical protein